MKNFWIKVLCAGWMLCSLSPIAAQTAETKTITVPRFEADVSQVPELQPWGRAAEALCAMWYPQIVMALKSDDSARVLPPVVKIIFEKDMKSVAHVAGPKMHIAAGWVKSHPNDFGMVIHELTHLVQRYPRSDAGWLVEGIADYVRSKYFEPNLVLPRINFEKAKWTDAYKTTAAFLIWLETKHGTDVIPRLNAALRAQTYSDALFKEISGQELAALWTEFAQSRANDSQAVTAK